MSEFYWLQFFADGGAPGGEGDGAEGVSADDPGQQADRLEDLGVPKANAEKYRAAKARRGQSAPKAETRSEPTQTADNAEGKPDAESDTADGQPDKWSTFIADPEINGKLQRTIADRLKRQGKAHEEYMSKLTPALELIAGKYGIKANDDGSYDPAAIAKAIEDDDAYYEQKASELGVDSSVAKKLEQLERANARYAAQEQKDARDRQLRDHFWELQRQGDELKALYPDFNLSKELENPEFMKRTSPEVGMSVKEAFVSLHHDELMQQQAEVVARKAKEEIASGIRSGRQRARENGSAAAAAVPMRPNFKAMTAEERLEYIKRQYPPK